MMNCMISSYGLPLNMWGEALLTTNTILNRIPPKTSDQSPYEKWHKKPPGYKILKVWGCLANVQVPLPKRIKLGPKTIDCVFIGYANNSATYRFLVIKSGILDTQVNTIIESNDAEWFEHIFPYKDSLNDNKRKVHDLIHVNGSDGASPSGVQDKDLEPNETTPFVQEKELEPRRGKKVKVSEEYKAVILLNSIPDIYKEVKNAIKYGRDTLTPEIVIDSLRSKEMEMKAEKHDKKSGEIHMMRSRTQFRQTSSPDYQSSGESSNNGGKKKGKSWSRSKSRVNAKKCYGCGNTGHFIKDCHKANNKQTGKGRDEVNVMSSSNSDQGEVYVLINSVVETAELNLIAKSRLHAWVLDSGASFHVS
ncbi:DNA polymerase zeta catalytic subunit-like [Abeliophyllum distichum]|uniref:DNA polymerase zeta catalytic subunit-like n=1 Tax=Abeliophyllum distichum TaxID=126358 RepID=A0ABD1V9H5_9LAMI